MPTITLDSIRESIEVKYEPLKIPFGDQQVELVQALRLPKTKREQLNGIQDRINASDGDTEVAIEGMRDLIRLVAIGPVDAFLDAIAGDDEMAILGEVIHEYSGTTRAGEASASPA